MKEKERTLEDTFKEIHIWLQELTNNNKDALAWFRYEFERQFPTYKQWKHRKENPILVFPGGKSATDQ